MKMLTLPNGQIINPACVKGVSAHSHLFSPSRSYVQLDMKKGGCEVIGEKFTPEAAEEMKATYLRLIEGAYDDVVAYRAGYDDGRTEGKKRGRAAGYNSGRTDGYAEGFESGRSAGYGEGWNDGYSHGGMDGLDSAHQQASEQIIHTLSDVRDNFLREQIDSQASNT
jgi:flagellar biosynthesis/type III secretory pathway protein FliH